MTFDNSVSKKPPTLEKNSLFSRILGIGELVPLALLIILTAMFYFISPAFVSTLNISNMLAYAPELGIIALGLTVLMTSGEIDLSVGALFGCVPVFLYIIFNQHWLPFWAAFVASLILAALIGLVNGLIVTKFHISSLIVTLGMMLVVRGSALYFTNGFPQQTWKTQSLIKSAVVGLVGQVGEFKLLASLIWFIGIAVILHFILSNTRFGNWIMATGGNIKSAKGRGVNTDKVKIILFINCSLLAGFAGIMDALRVESAYPIAGTGYEMEAIAMVVIGGTLLWGGKGTIIGTVIGVFLLRIIRNGIIVVGVPGMAYNLFVGAIIIVMMIIHSIINRGKIGES